MIETYGIRSYTCSEKTKRPQKKQMDIEKLEKRNAQQKRLYITLHNIDEIFSQNNDKYPVCYDLIFNLIQGKVTKYFNGRSFDRKKELSYDCINVLYSVLKRKLLKLKQEQVSYNTPPVLFFYLSQFFRYIDLVVYSVVHYGTIDLKYILQEPENFNTDDVLQDTSFEEYICNDIVEKPMIENVEQQIQNFDDNSEYIKKSIEENCFLCDKERNVLLKIYKNSYSPFGANSLTKRDNEILVSIQKRLQEEPELLKDLEEILNAK